MILINLELDDHGEESLPLMIAGLTGTMKKGKLVYHIEALQEMLHLRFSEEIQQQNNL